MKRIKIIAALLLAAISSFAQNGKSIYEKYSGTSDVSAVYISPAMFRLIGRIPDLSLQDGDVNLAPIIKSLSGLYIISSGQPSVTAQLKADVDKFVSSGHYELLMETKSDGEVVSMYTTGTARTVTGFVMVAIQDNEANFICLDGNMDRNDLETLLSQAR